MKLKNILLLITVILCSGNKPVADNKLKSEEHEWIWNWINSWNFISRSTFALENTTPPKILFYDDQYVYTNSSISAPRGVHFSGPGLYDQEINWSKQLHNDTLVLPDNKKVPLQLMTFAAPMEEGSYFVMPAPGYWKKVGLKNDIVSTNKMLNGIFVHEFAHTRQMETISQKLLGFQQSGKFNYPINDDIVQNYFQNDTAYTRQFRTEVDRFYNLLTIQNLSTLKSETKRCLEVYKTRQQDYLLPINSHLAEMEDLFLTMEGIGQYAMLSYYLSENGGNLSFENALMATRHNKRWWSQEEGLALILVYEKLVGKVDWSKLFFMTDETIVRLIENELQ